VPCANLNGLLETLGPVVRIAFSQASCLRSWRAACAFHGFSRRRERAKQSVPIRFRCVRILRTLIAGTRHNVLSERATLARIADCVAGRADWAKPFRSQPTRCRWTGTERSLISPGGGVRREIFANAHKANPVAVAWSHASRRNGVALLLIFFLRWHRRDYSAHPSAEDR